MKFLKLVLSVLICVAISGSLFAQELSPADQEALNDTKALLNDSQRIEENKKKNPKALNVDKNLDAQGFNAKDKGEIYGLSSEIFEQIVKETNGDAVKMEKILSEALKDPEAFAKRWSPEQKAKLKALANESEKKGNKVKKP